MLSIIWYLLLSQFLLSQWSANVVSSSLSVPTLFFLLTVFLAQLHFIFCLSILHAPSFSRSTSQMLPLMFAHSVVGSMSLQHIMLHSTQRTSLAFSLVLFQGPPENASLSVKSFFCHCYPLLYFLTAVQVITDIVSQVFEAVHLFYGTMVVLFIFTFIPYSSHLSFSSINMFFIISGDAWWNHKAKLNILHKKTMVKGIPIISHEGPRGMWMQGCTYIQPRH